VECCLADRAEDNWIRLMGAAAWKMKSYNNVLIATLL
jgi:hypothetical protein